MLIYEDKVALEDRGIFGFGHPSIEFYFQDLSGVEHKRATLFSGGHIKFIYPGSHCEKDEYKNSFVYLINRDEFDKAYEYIKNRIEFYKKNKNVNVGGISQADELRKFKELLDEEVITKEEFEKKKKEILWKQ